ncbi:MAG: hypothetical protein L0Y54_24060 [Sporichthyaceae bacterium]|nr:hypothetical protein [Sporichthyaceae bacterium]
MIDWILAGLVDWLVGQAVSALDSAADIWPDGLFTMPDLTMLPQVQALSSRTLWVVNTSFVLAVLAAGIIAMTYEQVQVRYSIKELAPRLVFAAVAANFAIPLCQSLINVANALTMALADQQITGPGVLVMLTRLMVSAQDQTTDLLLVVLALVMVILVFALVFGWLTRITGLLILIAIAPAALACYALPYTEGAARLWWRSMLGCLGTQTLQVITVVSGLKVLLDPSVNLPALVGMGGGAVVNMLIALVVLVTAVRIPSLVRRYVTRGGPGIGSYILRVVLVQQAIRAVIPGGGRLAGRVVRRVR